ncbi:MAG TPA: vanadium-dependent haloperoxidase [Pyrinomonadaceae bacterium]|nr:vanadium-dependent haloperoxidase [Pyrinomonadaceae bacterium]
MNTQRSRRLITPTIILLILCAAVPARPQGGARRAEDVWGPRYKPAAVQPAKPKHPSPHDTLTMLRHWNEVAINSSGLDHTPVLPGDPRVFGEQLGPARASRAIAIVHIAVFEAVNAIKGGYRSYVGVPKGSPSASVDAAIAQAAHDTLNALFPSQAAACTQLLIEDLARIKEGKQKAEGIRIGQQAAAATLALRAGDGSLHDEPRVGFEFITSDDPGKWRRDPISMIPLALGAHWSEVTPFVMQSASQFRTPPPPALDSPEYAAAFEEVQRLGGDGINTPTVRTPEQTEIGIYWAYDGTPSLCAPPRLYNQIAVQIARQMRSDAVETARLLALLNTALADAGVASWESKYYYQFWRPITGIRESDAGTGPTGLGDGNGATFGDPNFTPLGAPASNLTGPNFTPPFPAYPSGHAVFGGALFQTLRKFYGTDRIPFTFVSDELNGVTVGNDGVTRAFSPRSFETLSEAEEENGQSRIYLGIHWAFDKTEGITQGRRVADYVFANAFTPLRGPNKK